MANQTYYWKCPVCDIAEQPCESTTEALKQLCAHEDDKHDSKPVGHFGVIAKEKPKEVNVTAVL